MTLSRRAFLSHAAIAAGTAALPVRLALADAVTDKRLVVVLLRGGMDGLSAVPPLGDLAYRSLRGKLAISDAVQLDGFFGLHPSLEPLKPWYDAGELLAVHAAATPYRERSHFDAQDVMENGAAAPGRKRDGWLNRTVALLGGGARRLGLALGQSTPLILRGDAPILSWSPSPIPEAHPEFIELVAAIYRDDDLFAKALADGRAADEMAGGQMSGGGRRGGWRAGRALFEAGGRMLADPEGPRIATLEQPGWDTHVGQGAAQGRLANALKGLADNLVAMKATLGPVWQDTAVVVITEFGRTVRPNGSGGTDHGTATAALLAGGAVAGRRIIANWPGLNRLHEGRDLAPTLDLRAVLKAVLRDHLEIPDRALTGAVFPGSEVIAPMPGLIRV